MHGTSLRCCDLTAEPHANYMYISPLFFSLLCIAEIFSAFFNSMLFVNLIRCPILRLHTVDAGGTVRHRVVIRLLPEAVETALLRRLPPPHPEKPRLAHHPRYSRTINIYRNLLHTICSTFCMPRLLLSPQTGPRGTRPLYIIHFTAKSQAVEASCAPSHKVLNRNKGFELPADICDEDPGRGRDA